MDDYKAAFDLTDFGSADTFSLCMNIHSLEYEPHSKPFTWRNEHVKMVTCCNPLTGSHKNGGDYSKGYASYIHIQGNEDAVVSLYDDIVELAEYIKGKSLGRWDY